LYSCVLLFIHAFFQSTKTKQARRAQQREDDEETQSRMKRNRGSPLVIEGEASDLSGDSFDLGNGDEHFDEENNGELWQVRLNQDST